jgi:hypothetical protein
MIPVQKKGPAWLRTGKHDITLDPMADDGIKPLLQGYTKDKEHTTYDLKLRVDQYKHATEPDKYPKKFVTMFVVDTKKGKVAAPTVEDLMDKLDQQQLRWQSVDGSPLELMVHDSLYSNDKVLELEMLEQMEKRGETKTANGKTIPAGLGEEARKRIQDLRWLVSRSGKPSKPTGPKPTVPKLSPEAAAAAAMARGDEISRQLAANKQLTELKRTLPARPAANQGSNGGNTPRSQASSALSIRSTPPSTPTPILGPSPASSPSSTPKPTKGGKQRTRHARNRRNKTKRNKTNRR